MEFATDYRDLPLVSLAGIAPGAPIHRAIDLATAAILLAQHLRRDGHDASAGIDRLESALQELAGLLADLGDRPA